MYRKYLWSLLRHKYFVFIECCKLGIPLAGLVHDWSKFLPDEFFAYARYFHGEPIGEAWRQVYNSFSIAPFALEKMAEEIQEEWQRDFERAWLYHQRRQPHHWQYWYLVQDEDEPVAIEMPLRYRKEMLADWRGAGRAYTGKDNTLEWYTRKRDGIKLGFATHNWIETELGYKGDSDGRR